MFDWGSTLHFGNCFDQAAVVAMWASVGPSFPNHRGVRVCTPPALAGAPKACTASGEAMIFTAVCKAFKDNYISNIHAYVYIYTYICICVYIYTHKYTYCIMYP